MPKELIHCRGSDYYVRVGWSREAEYVQLATANPDGALQERLKDGTYENIETIEDHGWFVHLDRSGINDLIRTLRKARDAAFGRDE